MIKMSVPIVRHNLPVGPRWEQDGSCWRAEKCHEAIDSKGWRWAPQNWKAFSKTEPKGEMTDFYPLTIGETKSPVSK